MFFFPVKKRLRPFFLFLLLALPLFSQTDYGLSGPFYRKNFYLAHLPVYTFPGMSPRSGKSGESYLTIATTCVNEFVAYDLETEALDYESTILEGGYRYRISDELMVTADIRLISYYGGVFDPVIERFHSLFGFPNAGRELFDQNRLIIDLDNLDGKDISLDHRALSLGDTDLSGIWTFRERPSFVLAAAGSLKLPTGNLAQASGSGAADVGLQILGEWMIHPRWSFDWQQGVVFPGDWAASLLFGSDTYATRPVSQTTLALGFLPGPDWKILAQIEIETSPIRSGRFRTYSHLGTVRLFTLPQTAFLLGVKKSFGDWVMQVHFEEDPFTYEGADILLALRMTKAL